MARGPDQEMGIKRGLPMDKEQVLKRELTKLGAIGGGAGGIVGGGLLSSASGAIGAASGAWIASRFLPTDSYTRNCLITCDAQTALSMIVNVVARIGRLQDSSEIKSPNPTISAVIGSGFMKMNPCVLTVELISCSDKETTAIICGAAKEGLIKQRTAEKAVMQVIDGLMAEILD